MQRAHLRIVRSPNTPAAPWHWHLRSRKGKIIASGGGYTTAAKARAAVNELVAEVAAALDTLSTPGAFNELSTVYNDQPQTAPQHQNAPWHAKRAFPKEGE